MPPKLAFTIGITFVVFVFLVVERKREQALSRALIWPLIWYILAASRSVAVWLSVMGISLPGGFGDNEGNIIDRSVFFFLCLIGGYVLMGRDIDWASIRRENRWLIILFLLMLLSVTWSDFAWISFKRFVKSFTAVVMVLVVLTDRDPFAAIETIIRRSAYILIPLSIIVIKYFRSIGVQYDWVGTGTSWVGLSTSKNTLGQVVMISALYFVWSILRNRGIKRPWATIDYLYLAMCAYLLKGSDKSISLTSLSVFVVGLLLLGISYCFRQRLQLISSILTLMCISILAVESVLIIHTRYPFAVDSPFGVLIRGLGRDITLSGRTGIWNDVLNIASRNPFAGLGFGGFWIGRVANIPWDANLSWVLGEGHNGYLDVYLQLGFAGVFLLLGVVFSARRGIVRAFADDFEFGRFRLTFLVIILFVNITESTFLRGEHLLWFVLLLTVISVPAAQGTDLEAHVTEGDEVTVLMELE